MGKSTRSVLKSYKSQYKKSQNAWKKMNGFPTKKKPAFYDKYYTTPKPYKAKKMKAINTKYYTKTEPSKKSSSNQNSGCYIATCVYGSYDCPEVWTLRRFRDYKLHKTWFGRLFIHFYYKISPTIVKWFGSRVWFKKMWKKYLDAWVSKLNESGFENSKYIDE